MSVSYNYFTSSYFVPETGVPRDSNLGLPLSILFINEITDLMPSNVLGYAGCQLCGGCRCLTWWSGEDWWMERSQWACSECEQEPLPSTINTLLV